MNNCIKNHQNCYKMNISNHSNWLQERTIVRLNKGCYEIAEQIKL